MKDVFNFEWELHARVREWVKRQLAPGSQRRSMTRRFRARLRDFARRIERALLRMSHLRASRDDRRWAAHAFRDFVIPDGRRGALLSSLAIDRRVLWRHLQEWRADEAKGRLLAKSLLTVCTAIDDGVVWHKDLKLRSYVDVSIQMKALRIFVDYLSADSGDNPISSLTLTALLLKHSPNSRAALLVHAELLLESGQIDSAIDAIQRGLRIQAVCPSSQQLLFRAYQARRDAGSTDDALNVLDYELKDKFCMVPFQHLSTGWQGNAHLCACPAWVPFPIGSVLTAESADTVWNSDEAVEIRRSILDGDFSYCSRTLCSFITTQKLPRKDEITNPIVRRYIDNHTTTLPEPPQDVDLNYDTSCNLACPSCRTEILAATDDEQDLYSRARDRVILPLLKEARGQLYLSGGGEAFASKHHRSILSVLNRQDYPGLKVFLITNAQLLTPQRWHDYPNLPEMVGTLSVSIDAARAESYEKLRRPGKWSTLMRNLEFIAEMRRSGEIRQFWINFVVQKDNYREMLEFVELGTRLGVDQIWFQKVTNYGAYDEATFGDIDVTSPQHPEHAELLEVLRSPLLQGPLIHKEMLVSLLPEAVASNERVEFLY